HHQSSIGIGGYSRMSLLKSRRFQRSLSGPAEQVEVRNSSIAVVSLAEPTVGTLDTNGSSSIAIRPLGAASLGPPMDIQGAAILLGCSTWTVRQRLTPRGCHTSRR